MGQESIVRRTRQECFENSELTLFPILASLIQKCLIVMKLWCQELVVSGTKGVRIEWHCRSGR